MTNSQCNGQSSHSGEDGSSVAIIGLSCRFPGEASTPEGFWELLCKGRSALSEVPPERFNVKSFRDGPSGGLNRSITSTGHFLSSDIKRWDANFFGITPEEAEAMDPQQRLMMEVAYEAFENAGITPEQLSGSGAGCWMGVNSNDWRETLFRDPEAAPMHTWTGTGPEYISGRVSWFYNMRGPCMTVNTACSSSLVALHQACQSIQSGECEVAIVGGANLIFNPEYYLFYSNQKFLSKDGRCKSFDANGDGFGRGEGFGAVILKRTGSAVRDGDLVRALVRGTGVGQDGWTSGITLPNADAQAELIRRTYAAAKLPMSETDYVEAHGTGTKVGDPAELEAIYDTIDKDRSHELLLGSVKTNIGHLEGAAGIAGVIKGVLMLEKAQIPPTIGIKSLNPRVDWEKWRLRVVDNLMPWPEGNGPRRISISSFGASGTIAHAILDDAGAVGRQYRMNATTTLPKLFAVSGNDPKSVDLQKEALTKHIQQIDTPPPHYFDQLAHTLTTRRSHLTYRSCAVTSDLPSLAESLKAASVQRSSAGCPRIGFIFTGQGAQWGRMGMELLAYPVFRERIRQADKYLQSALGCKWSAMEELMLDAEKTHVNQAEYSQPLCTMLQVALVDLLESWNIAPTAMAGHSSGEIAAAYCLGALSAEEAWTAAYWRGNVDKRSALPRGAMLAAGISAAEASTFISQLTQGMAVVGCVNSPSSVTISGDDAAITEISDLLTKAGKFNRRLKVDTAYHSPHLSVISTEYLTRIRNMRPKPARPGRTMHSSVTGKLAAAAELGASNWVRNLVSPVLFADAVESMLRSKQVDVLLEVGPHAALAAPVKSTLSAIGVDKEYLNMLSRGTDGVVSAMTAAAELLARGVPVNVQAVNREDDGGTRFPLADLPPYPWNHESSYWAQSRWDREYCMRPHPAYRFIGAPMPTLVANEHIWRAFIRPSEETWVVDHKIQGVVVYPAVGYVAMAIESARQLAPAGRPIRAFRLRDVKFLVAAEMNESAATEMTLCVRPAREGDEDWFSFSISSSSDGTSIRRNCTGQIRIEYVPNDAESAEAFEIAAQEESIRQRYREAQAVCRRTARPEAFYAELARIGLEFGPAFRNIAEIRKGDGQSCCLVDIVNPAGHRDQSGDGCARPFIIHPATFDPITQTIVAAAGLVSRTPIPIAVDELVIAADIPVQQGEQLAVFTNVQRRGYHAFLSDVHALEPSSLRPVLSLTGLKLAQIAGRSQLHDTSLYSMCSRIEQVAALDLLKPEDLERLLKDPTNSSDGSTLVQVIRLLAMNSAECSVLEVSQGEKLLDIEQDDRLRDVVSHTLATWNGGEARLQSKDAASHLDSKARYDVLILPPTESSSIQQLLADSVSRLKPTGFLAAVGDLESLEAAMSKQDLYLHAKMQSDNESGLLIAGLSGDWTEVITSTDVVIIEPTEATEIPKTTAELLEQQFEQQRVRPVRIKWSSISSYLPLLKRARCICLMELGEGLISEINEEDFAELRLLLTTASDVLWVTAGDDPAFFAIDGMARSIRNEDASVTIRTLHLPNSEVGPEMADVIFRTATHNTRDSEFTVDQDGIAYVNRITADPVLSDRVGDQELSVMENTPLGKDGIARKLEIGELGQPDTLHFVQDESVTAGALGDDEVLLQVAFSGLNFKDIMIAMGRVAGTMEGAEGSGTILAVGKSVRDFKPGDRVLCLSIGMHSSIAKVSVSSCRHVPESMQLEEAASLPVVHCTAYNAFVRLARPEAGQSVLIHAGAGGLGQVAIQYALYLQMEVFVTVGSSAKRELIKELYGLEDDHILNSRNTSFAMAIKRVTHDHGVDVVLNSLSGDILRESWKCLAPGGTFVEVGKAVLDQVKPPHEVGATYTTFDVEHIIRNNPKLTGKLLDGALDFVRRGIIKPVEPRTVFPVSEVHKAVRLMQTGQHTGKLLLSWSPDDVVPVLGDGGASAKLQSDATYVLVGGLGGIGRSLAGMLVELGAQHLCFLSRSGPKSASAQALLDDLKSQHINARAYACDVADKSQLQEALTQCEAEMPPIRGVLQCAAVFRDAIFANQTLPQWQEATRPKIQASWNVHELLPKELDFFVLLSSFAGLFGNLGQSSYGAGSSYQDALSHWRRSQGLRAVSIDLGIINDVGVLAETGMTENLQEWACFGIGEVQLQKLIRATIQDQVSNICNLPPQIPTGIASRGAALAAGIEPPFYLQDPRFALLTCDGQQQGQPGQTATLSFAKRLSAAKSPEQAGDVIRDMLVHKVAKCLAVTEDRIDVERSLPAYGINSLVAIEIRNWIFKEVKVDVAIFDLISPLPIQGLVEKIAKGI